MIEILLKLFQPEEFLHEHLGLTVEFHGASIDRNLINDEY